MMADYFEKKKKKVFFVLFVPGTKWPGGWGPLIYSPPWQTGVNKSKHAIITIISKKMCNNYNR